MNDARICTVVRIYDESGDYKELRYDNVSCECLPADVLESLLSGEVICFKIMPNVELFSFKRPDDWPENWTKLGGHNIGK